MIAANELRLGNYCEYYIEDNMKKSDPGFWVKNKIDLQDIECCLNNKEHFDKYYRTMPLTAELLEKCGFEKANDNFGGYLSPLYKVGRIRINDNEWYNSCFYTTVKYLHQLQNLIFALTGTELEIKL